MRRAVVLIVAAAAFALPVVVSAAPGSTAVAPLVALPPLHVAWDYQIGGGYPVPGGVGVVSRDRHARPAPGVYNVCYVNAFQTQPGAARWWRRHHPRLLLRRADGSVVVDGAWNEMLLDVGTADKRRALGRIVGGWIDGCAADGFDAVEPDNLDSWTRSGGRLSRGDAFAFVARLAQRAHADGLAIAQKNAAGQVDLGVAAGLDFAVAEECARWHECGAYARAYADHVLVVEYRGADFAHACAAWGSRLAVVRRDRAVTRPGSPTYVFASC